MIDYDSDWADVIEQIKTYEELVSKDVEKILLKSLELPKIQQLQEVNLYHHQKESA